MESLVGGRYKGDSIYFNLLLNNVLLNDGEIYHEKFNKLLIKSICGSCD